MNKNDRFDRDYFILIISLFVTFIAYKFNIKLLLVLTQISILYYGFIKNYNVGNKKINLLLITLYTIFIIVLILKFRSNIYVINTFL